MATEVDSRCLVGRDPKAAGSYDIGTGTTTTVVPDTATWQGVAWLLQLYNINRCIWRLHFPP